MYSAITMQGNTEQCLYIPHLRLSKNMEIAWVMLTPSKLLNFRVSIEEQQKTRNEAQKNRDAKKQDNDHCFYLPV